jgi:hypothetical protein
MESFLDLHFSRYSCKSMRIMLALFWICGLGFGTLLGVCADEFLSPVSHIDFCANKSDFSFVLLFNLLPLCFYLVSFYISQPFILFFTVFSKAFLFSLSVVIFYFAAGTSAWLISFFVFMGDALVLASCWFTLYRSLCSRFSKGAVLILLATVIFITLFDYLCIAPFLAKLI